MANCTTPPHDAGLVLVRIRAKLEQHLAANEASFLYHRSVYMSAGRSVTSLADATLEVAIIGHDMLPGSSCELHDASSNTLSSGYATYISPNEVVCALPPPDEEGLYDLRLSNNADDLSASFIRVHVGPKLVLYSLWPQSGPVQGGTMVTVFSAMSSYWQPM